MIKVYKMIAEGEAAKKAASLYDNLPPKLKKYVDGKKNINAKRETLCCFCLLRSALKNSRYSLSDLYYEKSGKPCIDGLFVSFSHSGNLCVCAVGDRPLGVDAERITEKPRLATRVFNEREREYVGDNTGRFFEIWTKKEAASKLTGGGIKDFHHIDTFSETYKFTTCKTEGCVVTLCELND